MGLSASSAAGSGRQRLWLALALIAATVMAGCRGGGGPRAAGVRDEAGQAPIYTQPPIPADGYSYSTAPAVAAAPRPNYTRQADALLSQGNVEAALALLEQAIAENPSLLDVQLSIGDIHRKVGDYDKAERAYERATAIDPSSFDAHYYLALMRQLLGKYLDAVNSYLFALAINPQSFDANHHLATVYLQLGRPAEAVPYARKATEMKPDHQGAWANLGVVYSMMRLYEKAVASYRQAAELGELSEPIALGLADAHNKLGNYERAIAVLNTQIRRQPSAIAHERLGYAQFKLKRFEEAMGNFRAALLYNPNYSPALNGLGVCLMSRYIQAERKAPTHRDEALAYWQRSVQLQPGQPRIIALIEQFQLW